MSLVDLGVIVVYVLGCTALGAGLGRRARGLKDYFLGESNIPAWAVMISIVATETSAVTFLSVPGIAYRGDMTFLQLAMGYILARVVVAVVLLPAYFQKKIFTAYEVLQRRFGGATQKAAAVLFLVTRTLASGLRLFLAAKVLRQMYFATRGYPAPQGWELPLAIVGIGVVTIVYTYLGGIKAVVWTDVLQFFIYILGGLLALAILVGEVPGGWSALVAEGASAHKFRVFNFTTSLEVPYSFWAGVIGALVLDTGSHGVDQMMVQRYLSARSQRQAAWALVASGWVILAQFALFLVIGVGLWVLEQHAPSAVRPARDEEFASFIIRYLPTGVLGLVIAAVLSVTMSTVSGALSASASSTVNDLYRPLFPATDERRLLRLSKGLTAFWGLCQVGVALGAIGMEKAVIDNALAVAGFVTGILLGLFLLGLISRDAGQLAAFTGMVAGLGAVSFVAFGTRVAYPWYALVGASTVVIVGSAAALMKTTLKRPALFVRVLLLGGLAASGSRLDAALPEADPAALGLDAGRLARIDAAVNQAIAEGKVPGAVVLVGRRGKVVYARAFGQRAVEPAAEAMTRDTAFDLASLTKPVATATSVMILIEQGKIGLDQTLGRLLPEFDNHGKGAITVEQLLRHRSGLIADNPLSDYAEGPEQAWKRLAELELASPPGEKFVYSDVNYLILGRLVERVAGERLDRFAADHIFEPLGMTDTEFRPLASAAPPGALREIRIAPTERSDGVMLRGVVHDPRARALGGVAGHAGLFGTADDLALFVQMIVDGGRVRGPGPGHEGEGEGRRILAAATVGAMIAPGETPPRQRRGLGWDIATGYSAPRGTRFGPGSFGHTGFTGTSLWIDPETGMFVILLTSRLHPDGKAASPTALRSEVATRAAEAVVDWPVACGIDVLAAGGFERLRGKRVGLVTNHTGRTREGVSTIDVLFHAPGVTLVRLFSPEHGIRGLVDAEVSDSKDEATGLPVVSLYGKTRKPSRESLEGLDVLVYDIQDIGARFYTYISTLGLVLEAARESGVPLVVLDRPNPIGGVAVSGPVRDPEFESFIAHHALPVRHGMTVGELARLFNAERQVGADLEVIACTGWRRDALFDRTGLTWVNPSPNMRSLTEALLYPGVALLEATNLATGRGTDTPFERVGAPWIEPRAFAEALNNRGVPGVRFVPIRFTPRERQHAGTECGGVQIAITDWSRFEPLSLGITLALVLRDLYPDRWQPEGMLKLIADRATYQALLAGRDAAGIMALWQPELAEFLAVRSRYLIYEEEKKQ
jgi:SSS family transporter